MMGLFGEGEFRLHSGGVSRWKIDCDHLFTGDWMALALMLSEVLPPFGSVEGVPTGGNALASAMQLHATIGPHLIVDDVLTTGGSMEIARHNYLVAHPGAVVAGAVVFARGPCPDWIVPLFRMPHADDLLHRVRQAIRARWEQYKRDAGLTGGAES